MFSPSKSSSIAGSPPLADADMSSIMIVPTVPAGPKAGSYIWTLMRYNGGSSWRGDGGLAQRPLLPAHRTERDCIGNAAPVLNHHPQEDVGVVVHGARPDVKGIRALRQLDGRLARAGSQQAHHLRQWAFGEVVPVPSDVRELLGLDRKRHETIAGVGGATEPSPRSARETALTPGRVRYSRLISSVDSAKWVGTP